MAKKNLTKKMLLFGLIVVQLVDAQYSIRPSNSVTRSEHNITLHCQADDDNEDVIWYEYITNPGGIQISFNEAVRHPKGEEKYEILRKETGYNLLIQNTDGYDAGAYSCNLLGAGTYSFMELFVVTSSNSRCGTDFMEFHQSQLCEHEIRYKGGTWFSNASVIGIADESSLQIRHYDGSYPPNSERYARVDAYLTAAMPHYDNTYTCSIVFAQPSGTEIPSNDDFHFYDDSAPGTAVSCNITIDLQYLVREMCILPDLTNMTEVAVGYEITCNVSGNPAPHVRWNSLLGEESVEGGVLKVTEDMLGMNSYECVAFNHVGTLQRSIKHEVQFLARNISSISSTASPGERICTRIETTTSTRIATPTSNWRSTTTLTPTSTTTSTPTSTTTLTSATNTSASTTTKTYEGPTYGENSSTLATPPLQALMTLLLLLQFFLKCY